MKRTPTLSTPVDELLARARPDDPVRAMLARPLAYWRRGVPTGSAEDVELLADACRVTRAEAMRAVLATVRGAPPNRFRGAVNRPLSAPVGEGHAEGSLP